MWREQDRTVPLEHRRRLVGELRQGRLVTIPGGRFLPRPGLQAGEPRDGAGAVKVPHNLASAALGGAWRPLCPAGPALLLLGSLLASGPAGAVDPSLSWRTITTPHFYVHYYKSDRHDEREVAQQVARAAELAHAKLVPILGHAPSSRTHVVVTDDKDGADGKAQIVPYNIIRLWVTGPSSINPLNDYDNWMYGLIMHEYTHILHVDTIHGIARVVNAVLGKTWAPNLIQPMWFIEGMAVFSESEYTAGGRNRSSIYDMYLRAAVLEGRLLDIDQISSYTRYFPQGTVPYLYGSRFVKYLADRFGKEKLTRISHSYGGTTIPYAINRIAKEVLGHTFLELYEDFKTYLRQRYELQRAAVKRRGPTEFARVTRVGESCSAPRVSADGRHVAFIHSDGHSQSAVKVLDRSSGEIVEQFDVFGGSGLSFSPDGQYLAYGHSAPWRTFYSFSDIFIRHRSTGQVRRLTFGLRARDPAISPDGSRVAFVTNEMGSMSLAVVPFEGGEPEVLYRGKDGDQVFSPAWSPDSRHLAYSRRREGGHRDIYLMEVKTRKVRRLTATRALDTDPVFSSDGRRLYFSSDRTGIFNIFCLDLESSRLWQVSNVLEGAFTPAVTPDEKVAYYVGFSVRGFDLHAMKLDRRSYLPALPYVDDRPPPVKVPQDTTYPEEPYSSLQTFFPRAWMITFGYDAYGSTMGLDIIGGDVVGRHSYRLLANFSLENGHPSYSLSYTYSRLWPSIILDTSRTEWPRGGVVIDGESTTYLEEDYGAGAAMKLPVLRIPNLDGDITLGYRFDWFRDAGQTEGSVLVEPGMLSPDLPEAGILSGLTLKLSYGSVQRYTYSVSSEKGRAISFNMRVNHPSLGSDYQSVTFEYEWAEYVPLPWAEDHVLAIHLRGGIGSGDPARRGLFYVGGFPEQDVLRTLFETAPQGTYLRGYPPGKIYGDQYHLLNVEYRMPLFNIERGFSSLPLYFNHVHLAVHVDVGNAFFGQLDPEQLKVGVGAEVFVEFVIGYFNASTFRIGYARGLMEEGDDAFHFLLGSPF